MSKFKNKPYKHQLDCLNQFGRTPAFALLAEMGTGKTFIIINDLADLWSSQHCDAALIFAPNGVHVNWTRLELPKHMPDWVRWRAVAWNAGAGKVETHTLNGILEEQRHGELRLLTMNWEALQSKRGADFAMKFAKSSSSLMIVADESDSIKNPSTTRAKMLMKLKPFSVWRRIMTGTPVNNAPFDLFNQFLFLNSRILGTTSYYAFKAEYAELLPATHGIIKGIVDKNVKMSSSDRTELARCIEELDATLRTNGRADLIGTMVRIVEVHEAGHLEKILEHGNALLTMIGLKAEHGSRKAQAINLIRKIIAIAGGYTARRNAALNPHRIPQIVDKSEDGLPKYRNLEKLSRLIAPHSFRVLKSECLDLPEKIYKTVLFDLTPQQHETYRKAENECRLLFEGKETPFTKLVAVQKLAQITSGYYLHPEADEPVRIEGENPKLNLLVERVQAIVVNGEKVIVWARYRVEIEDICKRLDAANVAYVQYHGGTSQKDRLSAIDEFENGEAKVFVGNQQAGGTGINLVAASFVIYFSNNFSLRDRLQSEDRAHRIGQTKNVVYINLVAQDTIDEKVVAALINKQGIAQMIVDNGMELFKKETNE